MDIGGLFSQEDLMTLYQARATYGAHKQIGVAAEECTELAKELIKAFRYDDFSDAVQNTKENVIDEVADVLIVLDHVIKLYNITEQDLAPQVHKKISRLAYWLKNSDSIEFTTQHRSLDDRSKIPYDAFGDYSPFKDLKLKGKNVYENEHIKLVDGNDDAYRE